MVNIILVELLQAVLDQVLLMSPWLDNVTEFNDQKFYNSALNHCLQSSAQENRKAKIFRYSFMDEKLFWYVYINHRRVLSVKQTAKNDRVV